MRDDPQQRAVSLEPERCPPGALRFAAFRRPGVHHITAMILGGFEFWISTAPIMLATSGKRTPSISLRRRWVAKPFTGLYARKAKVIVPALESYENGKAAENVIALPEAPHPGGTLGLPGSRRLATRFEHG